MDRNEQAGMVVVATASQPMEATMLQVQLGACGIDSELDGEFTVSVNPLLSNAIGGIRILVAASVAEQARAILTEQAEARKAADAAQARQCPACGCENGTEIKHPHWAGLVAALTLFEFSLFFRWPRFACPACKHKWR